MQVPHCCTLRNILGFFFRIRQGVVPAHPPAVPIPFVLTPLAPPFGAGLAGGYDDDMQTPWTCDFTRAQHTPFV